MEKIRRASHAGSWYTDNPKKLEEELEGWLGATGFTKSPDVRGVIAPHAGYSYSGRAAAYAFGNIDPTNITRVFLLGPSRHYYTSKCALSTAMVYKTPIGDLPIDLEAIEELKATGKFELMDLRVDEAEHSMEMHLLYLAKIFEGHPVKVVPILVGALSADNEAMYGRLLAKYVDDPTNFFSVSSDFCHWGSRIDYTHYDKKCGPMHKSIEALDKMGMDIIETGNADAFKQYLSEYENTICGRHPISVFLHEAKQVKVEMSKATSEEEDVAKRKGLTDDKIMEVKEVIREPKSRTRLTSSSISGLRQKLGFKEKTKVVIKVDMASVKDLTKVMKIVAGFTGVLSVGLGGEDKSQLEVIGDGVDPVQLTTFLRKKFDAELISVAPVMKQMKDSMEDEPMLQHPTSSSAPHHINPINKALVDSVETEKLNGELKMEMETKASTKKKPDPENQDGSDTEDDEEDDDEDGQDDQDDDDDAGDEEDEPGKDGEDGEDPEDEPEVNGDGGSDDDDEEDDDDEDDEDDDDEEEEEEDEEDIPQPPAKRRK